MKKFLLYIFLILCINFSLSARGNQELVPAGHWIYDSVLAISVEEGIVNFADSAPLSIQELKVYLSELDYDSMSEASKTEYDRIFAYFNETNFAIGYDILSIGLEPTFNLAAFGKSSSEIDWVFDRYSRKPLLDTPATITAGDYATFSMDVYLAQNRGMSLHNYNYTNVPLAADQIDIEFPDTGYFSTGYMLTEKTGFGFQLGSGSRSIGNTLTGSMIWSEYLTGVAYAQMEFYNPVFKYTGSVSQFNVDKYMYAHEIDVRLFKKFQITFMEGLLVYAPMELRFMNPWTIFHGFAAWRDYDSSGDDTESNTCDYFGIKFQYTPVKNWRLYGLFAMTQFQTPFETSNFENDTTPNGLGVQGGTDIFIPVSNGRFRFSLEGSWADPYLYIKESPNWSMVRTYSENIGDYEVFYEWIGSPFGPDTISAELKAGYEVPEKWALDLIYLYMARGEYSGTSIFNSSYWGGSKRADDGSELGSEDGDYAWPFPDNFSDQSYRKQLQSLSCPSGTPEFVNRLSVRATMKPKKYLTFIAQPSYTMIFNRNHIQGNKAHGFEFAAMVSINFINYK
ncbi:hypothetical protein [Treponema sp.]|uniref:hypothetical protein n=1 Tax=Treponema sp. TaxID=166 RepID=UPI00388EE38B